MRLFVAINFTPQTHARLIDLRETLRAGARRGNFSRDENLHLTLVFIGEVSPKKLERLRIILDTVTYSPFPVTVKRLGTFSRGTLWWAGVGKTAPLMDLQHQIEYKLALGGFEMDGRAYKPHITLGREVVTDQTPWPIDPFGETVQSFALMCSERINGKLTYTALASWQAREPEEEIWHE